MLTLLYDPRDEETVRGRVLALFEGATAVPLDASALPDLAAGSTVVRYMSDAALAGVIPEAAARAAGGLVGAGATMSSSVTDCAVGL